jgi:hypothetical protein
LYCAPPKAMSQLFGVEALDNILELDHVALDSGAERT